MAQETAPRSPDRDVRWLQDRIRGTVSLPAGVDASANALWTLQAPDNSECVRGVGDVTGDGIPDAVSGHSILGSGDNFYAISGASSGAASVAWQQETVGGLSGGYFWGDECISRSSDFTGDGFSEVLVGLAGGGRTANCFDGNDGSLVWQFSTYSEPDSGWVYSIREMPDITGDSVPEVIFGCGSFNDSVYCIDGASTGTSPNVLWAFTALDAVFTVDWVPDVSGDGLPDVVAGTGDNDGRIYCLRSDTGVPIWIYDPGGSVLSMETVADVSGDGKRDIVASTWNSSKTVVCVASNNGGEVWTRGLGTFGQKVAPLADVSGDGADEVLVGSLNNSILCLDGATGATRWTRATGTLNGGDVWTLAAMPDVNGDDFEDVVAGSFDGYAYCVDGTDGSVIWDQNTGNRVFTVSWMGDTNGDGKPEALVGTQDTTNNTLVYGIEGDSGLVPPYVALTGTGEIGTTIRVHTTGLPGDEYILFIALGSASIPVGGLGTLLLQPSTLRIMGQGVVPSDGTENTDIPLPPEPLLVGFPLHFQSLVGPDIFGGLPKLTNSVMTTISN